MSVDACGCCDPGQPATPRTVWNRPGLAEVAYRMGTYADFREAMLQRVAREPALRPWTARTDDDYGMAVLDLWSYVADILTFYQERTANEAFLRTARMPGSVRRLAALLGYVPAPGLAAEARLAFILDAGKRLTLRERMRVQSLPGDEPGAKPQKFETDAGLEATGELSSVPLRPPALSAATYADVAALTPAVNAPPPPPVGTELVFYASGSGVIERKRVNLVRQRAGLTEIRWEPPRGDMSLTSIRPLRRTVRLFGHDAPPTWLQRYVVSGAIKVVEVPIGGSVTVDGQTFQYPKGLAATTTLALDSAYPDLKAGTHLLIPSPSANTTMVATVKAVRSGPAQRGPLAGTVTIVELSAATPDIADVREAELYEVGDSLPIWDKQRPSNVYGSRAVAELNDPQPLEEGRELLMVDDAGHAQAVTVTASTPITIRQGASKPDHLQIDFTPALSPALKADSARLLGNVVTASHGETVADELLGTGDASEPFQTMRLAKSPVTYRPAPGGGRSDGSTLLVRVGGLQWHERDSLYGAAPADRAFVTHIDDAGRIAVRFGDGDSGARPATGAEVRASYRRGLGAHGNVPAGALSVPLDRPAGLKGVINPLPAAGGVDPERPSDTRVNAPGSVRTFGRIVSLRDFEDQARATGLVSKARAAWTWAGTEPLVALTVAGPGGAHVRDLVHEDLAADLDARRDPNRRLRIDDYDEVAIAVRAKIVAHDPDRKAEDVVAAATAALDALFAFDARGLGQPVHLSDVFAALQSATGVVGVDIDKLGYRDASAWTAHQLASVAVAEHLPVLPNELAALAAADREVTIQ